MCCTRLAWKRKYRTQKIAKNLPSGHYRTTLSGCIFATNTRMDNRKKILNSKYSNISSSCSHNIANVGPLNGWDQFTTLGHPSKFQLLSRIGFVTAATSLTGGQPNFARCLAVSWTATLYIHFRGILPLNGILPGAKFTLRTSLAFSYIGSITARQSSSGRQPNFAAWYKEWNYWTFADGATYIRLGGHHIGHRPIF